MSTLTIKQNVTRLTLPPDLLRWREGGRSKVIEEKVCRMCKRGTARRRYNHGSEGRRITRHHIVPQQWFKYREFMLYDPCRQEWEEYERHRVRDADANIVPLCVACHLTVERDPTARSMLRKVLGSGEATFCVRMRNQEWFERRYPPLRPATSLEQSAAEPMVAIHTTRPLGLPPQ